MEIFDTVKDPGGENFTVECPICGSPRMGVHREKRLFHCFKCDEGEYSDAWDGRANLVTMICMMEKVSKPEAVRKIFEAAGEMDYDIPREPLPEKVMPDDVEDLIRYPHSDAAMYLSERQLDHMKNRVGLSATWKGRLILPCWYFNKMVGFEAKAYIDSVKPKSLFPSWFKPSDYIYTSKVWTKDYDYIVLTESIFDAETVHYNAAGIFGSNLSERQLRILIGLKTDGYRVLYWMLDADALSKAVKTILRRTSEFFYNYVCMMPPDEDPNSIGRDSCKELIHSAKPVRDEFDAAKIL
jgi:hypothetical protein